jgi:hypothetical protein
MPSCPRRARPAASQQARNGPANRTRKSGSLPSRFMTGMPNSLPPSTQCSVLGMCVSGRPRFERPRRTRLPSGGWGRCSENAWTGSSSWDHGTWRRFSECRSPTTTRPARTARSRYAHRWPASNPSANALYRGGSPPRLAGRTHSRVRAGRRLMPPLSGPDLCTPHPRRGPPPRPPRAGSRSQSPQAPVEPQDWSRRRVRPRERR